MGLFTRKQMSREDVERILGEAIPAADDGQEEAAWRLLAPLEKGRLRYAEAARGLAVALGHNNLDRERRLELAAELLGQWESNDEIVIALGESAETLHDYEYLNAAPPTHSFFQALGRVLQDRAGRAAADAERVRFNNSLTTVARVLGRSWDDVCEAAFQELLRLRPDRWQDHYNYGLFLKTRGRFAEGVGANQRAAELAGEDDENTMWNLGICATGAGQGEVALKVWRDMENTIELGEDGYPEGRYQAVQVRLAERPLAERGGDGPDEPGDEETIWVDRLSPCHGRIVSALYQDLGVDYGDLVLFDGAPILSRKWGERMVPVFPHLATLKRCGWRIYWFAGTQEHEGQAASLEDDLPGDSTVYVHTEAVRILCHSCWESVDQSHEHQDQEHKVVRGKICVPPDVDLQSVVVVLDTASKSSAHLRILAPELHEAVGDSKRADVERRRFDMVDDN